MSPHTPQESVTHVSSLYRRAREGGIIGCRIRKAKRRKDKITPYSLSIIHFPLSIPPFVAKLII